MDAIRGPVKAGAAALFAVGLLLLFLNPPSLSGAEGMAVLVGGGILLVLLTAWASVALTGSDSMPEHEFERLVRRSEELAATPGLRAETSEFDLLVADAIDQLPQEFQRLLDDTPVVVSQHGVENRAYGHYFGDTVARDNYPDRIVLYQDTLSATSATTPSCCAPRWIARSATSWPTTSAGTSVAFATWGCRVAHGGLEGARRHARHRARALAGRPSARALQGHAGRVSGAWTPLITE